MRISLLLAAVLFATAGYAKGFWYDSGKQVGSVPLMSDTFVKVALKVQPALAFISTTQEIKMQRKAPFHRRRSADPRDPGDEFWEFFPREFWDFFPQGPEGEDNYKQQGLGSGFLINEDGYLLTNNHVVTKATEIKVTLMDERVFDAKVIGTDPQTDLALLKISGKGDFPYIPFGDSDQLRVGDVVIAVGNPFGLDHTVTQGIVSQKERAIGMGRYDQFIQTDASINPGNSGGPLLNINGDVIGINSAIKGMNTGIGFAIPINLAKNIVPQLKEKGKFVRGFLGVYVQKITKSLQQGMKLPSMNGALVSGVISGSPAEKAGIMRGDVIISFNGQEVKDETKLPTMVAHSTIGKKAKLVVLRDGKEKTFEFTVDELKDSEQDTETGEAEDKDEEEQAADLGLVVKPLTAQMAQKLGLPSGQKGVVIADLDRGSPAAMSGLQRGDVIVQINKREVGTMKEYLAEVKKLKKGDSVLLLVKRGDGTVFVAFTL